MSLLLDALKRAEQAKRGPALSLEPANSDIGADTGASRALLRPEVAGVAPGPALGSPAHRAEQEAARSLFMAKQPPVQNRPLWLLLGGLAVLAIAAGVFWLWYTVSYPSTQAPVALQSVAPLRPPIAVPAQASVPPADAERPLAEAPPPAPGVAPKSAPSKSEIIFSRPPVQAVSYATTMSKPTTPRTENQPQLKRSQAETNPVSPELNSAYSALTSGDYALARQQYQLVVKSDPFNLDAYLGLATAAAATGDSTGAAAYYRKALEIDPRNPVAGAGLVSLQAEQNAPASERQLRAQIAGLPDAPAPYSALGHVYSAQAQWGDAQQSFFEAYRLDPGNPDHAFNLAVSLDHLGQTGLARDYYNKALTLAAFRPAAFNPADVTARIAELKP